LLKVVLALIPQAAERRGEGERKTDRKREKAI
jgi:hypothetical protein